MRRAGLRFFPLAPRSLRLLLTGVQIATVATLMRSVALDRWITVAACLLLLAGANAAVRGRTWGVALAFLIGITFVSIWALGIAPGWFALVGLLAIRPFARLFRNFVRFDWQAAALLTSGATILGTAGAVVWKTFAHELFAAFPLLVPSFSPHHGFAVIAIGAAATLMMARQWRAEGTRVASEPERVRIASGVSNPDAALADEELLEEAFEAPADTATTRPRL